jgi:hypothetical protein
LNVKAKSTIINAINELVENNIIIKTDNLSDARRNDYFINPYTAWKGTSKDWYKAKKKVKNNNPAQTTLFGTEMEPANNITLRLKTDFTKAPDNKFDDFTEMENSKDER